MIQEAVAALTMMQGENIVTEAPSARHREIISAFGGRPSVFYMHVWVFSDHSALKFEHEDHHRGWHITNHKE